MSDRNKKRCVQPNDEDAEQEQKLFRPCVNPDHIFAYGKCQPCWQGLKPNEDRSWCTTSDEESETSMSKAVMDECPPMEVSYDGYCRECPFG